MTARELIEHLHGLGVDLSVDGDQLHVRATLQPLSKADVAALKANKMAVLSLLRTLPTYTHDQQFLLSEWHVAQDRPTRLEIKRLKDFLKSNNEMPEAIAFCMAIERHR